MLPNFLQRSSDTFGGASPLELHVWRLNIDVYAGPHGKKSRILRRFAKAGWTGMNLSSVSRYEWCSLMRHTEAKPVVCECFGVHDAEVDGSFYAVHHKGLWVPSMDYGFWMDAIRSMPRRVNVIPVGREPAPALLNLLDGLNWLVAPCADDSDYLLSVQDTPRMGMIETVARLSFR